MVEESSGVCISMHANLLSEFPQQRDGRAQWPSEIHFVTSSIVDNLDKCFNRSHCIRESKDVGADPESWYKYL